MSDFYPQQDIRDAAAKLRASMDLPDIKGEIDEASVPTLNFIVDLLKARWGLIVWLESWDDIDLDGDGSLPDDWFHAVQIARAINGSSPTSHTNGATS
jgi:hypothetical protein